MPRTFERLDPSRHNRDAFNCGESSLDTYLKQQASQDAKRGIAVCIVLSADDGSTIIGYYTLSASVVVLKELPPDLTKQLPRYPNVPAILLGRLAVAQAAQGQGISTLLLTDAVRRAATADVGAMALIVDALNDDLVPFYTRHGFFPLMNRPRRLFLPLGQFRGRFARPACRGLR